MNVTATVSTVMLVVAALVVSRTFTRAKEAAAVDASADGPGRLEVVGSVAAAE
jgi:hypothetical protein